MIPLILLDISSLRPNQLGIQQLAFFKWDCNIKAPMEPLQHGYIFVGLTDEHAIGTPGRNNCYELFIKFTVPQRRQYGDQSQRQMWRYMGTYDFERAEPVPVAEWHTFDPKVHNSSFPFPP